MVNMTLFQIQLLVDIRLDVNAAMHIVNLCGVIVQMKQLKLGIGGLMMARLIDADALIEEALTEGAYGYVDALQIENAPTVDAVPVSELEKLRDYLYAEDLIFMRGLAELNKLIANCCTKMGEVSE